MSVSVLSEQVDESGGARGDLTRLALLGPFRIQPAGGLEVEPLGRKAQALLAYLAATPGHRATRERLASLLWGERFDEQARQSLRQTLMALRRSLDAVAPGLLMADRGEVALAANHFVTDIAEFERVAARGQTGDLQAAVALWRGAFLADLDIPSPEYEDWLRNLREVWRLRVVTVRMQLAERLLAAGDGAAALLAAAALVDLDPLNEAARRVELAIVARFSGMAAALKSYQRFADLLQAELGVAPEAETRALIARLGGMQSDGAGAIATVAGGNLLPAAAIDVRSAAIAPPWRRLAIAATALLAVVTGAVVIGWRLHQSGVEQAAIAKPRMSFHVGSAEDGGGSFREALKTRLALLPLATLTSERPAAAFTVEATVLPAGPQEGGGQQTVSLRLIDTISGRAVWADSQAIAPDAVERAAASSAVRLYVALLEQEQQRRGPPSPMTPSLQAGWDAVAKGITRQGVAEGRRFFQAAVTQAPQDVGAHLGLAHYISLDLVNRWSREREADILQAMASLDYALQQMPRSTTAYFTIGVIHKAQRDYARALTAFEVLLAMEPRDALANSQVGHIQLLLGNIAEGVARAEMAIQLNPMSRGVDRAFFYAGMGHLLSGDYSRAEQRLARAIEANPHLPDSYIWRVSALAQAGRQAEAEALYAEMMKRFPWWNVDHHYTQAIDRSVMDRFVAGLSKVIKPG
ncbi:MAG: winged helix-turn-helix domain-containing protein [Alphaproteobacteria bacterium]|nr:winged helix-turn-helix domain-containing protein [Alphaproteobacteria bacterium]